MEEIGGIAVTNRPGLLGSLHVGLAFAKALAMTRRIPFVGIDHIMGHLYAPLLETELAYPYIALVVSGGHTIIALVRSFDQAEVLGTTIDDACGEAFDKVAKHYGFGYPGGVVIDRLAEKGSEDAFRFPQPRLQKGQHELDVSYSGLKTAVVNQLSKFRNPAFQATPENIAASFRRAAIDMIVSRVLLALERTGIPRLATGGGVAANALLRRRLSAIPGIALAMPSPKLCTDNAAMIAGLGYRYLAQGRSSGPGERAYARVIGFRKVYP
jgi:N6-L-threonylcarbamoyladenine synthase